jgi:hypothetical protein
MDLKMRFILKTLFLILLSSQLLSAEWAQVRVRGTSIYSSTNEDGVVLDVLPAGMMVDVMKTEGQWSQVKLTDSAEMGWVEQRFLRPAAQADESSNRLNSQQSLSKDEINRVRWHLESTSTSLVGVELQIEGLLDRMASVGIFARPERQPGLPQEKTEEDQPLEQEDSFVSLLEDEPAILDEMREYSWSNRFFMGKYVKGGEDLLGLGFSRMIDNRGFAELDFEACYGLGDNSGSRDDFLDWNLGLRFNLKPATYRIYPFLSLYGGMRHSLKVVPGRAGQQVLCSPGMGITAELGRVFILGIETRAVFLFHDGERTNEGRIAFSCLYRY